MKTVALLLRKKRLVNGLFVVYLLLVLRLSVFRSGFWPLPPVESGGSGRRCKY